MSNHMMFNNISCGILCGYVMCQMIWCIAMMWTGTDTTTEGGSTKDVNLFLHWNNFVH